MEKLKIILAFFSSIIILIIVGAFLFISTDKYKDTYKWVTHSQENISQAQIILSCMQDIETASRGYAITGKENYLLPYYKGLDNIDFAFARLKIFTHQNKVQQNLLGSLKHLILLKKNISKKIVQARQVGDFDEAKRIISSGLGESAMSEARNEIAELINNEKNLLLTRTKSAEQHFDNLRRVIIISVGISILFILIALLFFIRDYNKRISSEKKLIESELRIKNFLEALPVGVFIVDAEGKPNYINTKAEEMFGGGLNPEANSMELRDIYVSYRAGTDQIYPLEELPILRALKGEKNVHVDDLEIQQNGSRLPLRINASPIVDSSGKIIFAISVIEDITEIKKSERALLQANAELENIFKNAPTGIVLIDAEGKIIQWNRQAEFIFGWKSNEVFGIPLYQVIFRKDFITKNAANIHQFFETSGNGTENRTMEVPSRKKDDTTLYIGINVAPTNIQEEIFYIIFIVDISERRKTEEQLKTATAQLNEAQRVANVGSWEIDVINNKIVRSDELCRIYGLSREELDQVNYDSRQIHPEDKERVETVLANARKYHEPFSVFFRLIRPDGEERVIHTKGNVYTNNKKEAIRIVGTSQDVTDAKKSEQELVKAKQIAEQALVLKESFLANMSHEIRTPMNAIIGFTDILIKRDLKPQEKEYVQIIKNSGENLLRIINDILDISKIEADMIVFEEHPLSIQEIFKSLQIMLSQKALEKDLGLFYISDPDIPEVLLGDPTRITQILINLTGNAIKFTKTGHVEIVAKMLKDERERVLIQFVVKDTGIGIAENKLNTIFERFQQAEAHTTRNYGGTGLGLSIARQLVELQGGEMSINSELNRGTQVIFTLPFKKTKELYSPKNEEMEGNFDPKALQGLKILLAEDNPINVKLVLSLCTDYEIAVEVAENGKIAVEKIKENYYDLILMDMEMPEMNGYEATAIIRDELKNKVPIIAMTAHAMAGEKEKCFKLGMYDYISKPINANLLFEKIYNATEFVKNWNASSKKVINLNYLTDIMNGKKELIKETIEIFVTQASEDLPIITQAVNNTDYLMVKRFAHRMKSTVTMMGISSLSPVLEEMETLGKEAQNINRIKELNEKLNAIYATALEEIKIEKLKYN